MEQFHSVTTLNLFRSGKLDNPRPSLVLKAGSSSIFKTRCRKAETHFQNYGEKREKNF